jgi:hypothetical protein
MNQRPDNDERRRHSVLVAVGLVTALLTALWLAWPKVTPRTNGAEASGTTTPDRDGMLASGADPDASEGSDPTGRRPANLLSVRVKDAGGAAVAQATIVVSGERGADAAPADPTFVTDPRGELALPGDSLSPCHWLHVEAAGFRPTLTAVTQRDLARGTKDVVLHRAVAFRGTTIDHLGAPVADVEIVVYDGRFPDLRASARLGASKSDTNGRFEVPLTQAGEVLVVPRRVGYVAKNMIDAGAWAEVIRTTAGQEREYELRLLPVLVATVGLVNSSSLPNEELAHYCAFSRTPPPGLAELQSSMHVVESAARRHVEQIGSSFSHLGIWLGLPNPGADCPATMPVQVGFVDGTSVALAPRLVPLATMTVRDIATHAVRLQVDVGQIELSVRYPTTLTLLRDGHATVWQRTLEPAETARLALPAGRYVVAPSPVTLLDGQRRRRETTITKGEVTYLASEQEAPIVPLRLVVADERGPVPLRNLRVDVWAARDLTSLAGVTEPEILLYVEPGPMKAHVRDGSGKVLARHEFVATPDMPQPTTIRLR